MREFRDEGAPVRGACLTGLGSRRRTGRWSGRALSLPTGPKRHRGATEFQTERRQWARLGRYTNFLDTTQVAFTILAYN